VNQTGTRARIYTVVDVMAGVAVGAYTFRHLRDAQTCVARLREGRDLEEDDVRLFESVLDPHPDRNHVAEVGVQ
jgi:hypothetical protein